MESREVRLNYRVVNGVHHISLTHKPTGLYVNGDGPNYEELKVKLQVELEEKVKQAPHD